MKNYLWGMSCLVVLGMGQAFGSGWVKDGNSYYVKLDTGFQDDQNYNVSGNTITQSARTIGFYGEWGVNAPWGVQLSLSGTHKELVRDSQTVGDQFIVRGFTDTTLTAKHRLARIQGLTDLGAQLHVALITGATVPTSKGELRHDRILQAHPEVDPSHAAVLTGVDTGEWRYIGGLGTSVAAGSGWLNLQSTFTGDARGAGQTLAYTIELGVGLPRNSWLQTSSAWTFDTDLQQAESARENRLGLSLGLTVYQGFAFEAGALWIADSRTVDEGRVASYVVGLSKRTI